MSFDPTTVTPAKPPADTPGTSVEGGEDSAPAVTTTLFHFNNEDLVLMEGIITKGCTTSDAVLIRTELSSLLAILKSPTYAELQFFDWAEVEATLNNPNNARLFSMLLSSPLPLKKLSYLIRYAKLGSPLSVDLTLESIRSAVDAHERGAISSTSSVEASPRKSSKTDVPDLPKWDGNIQFFFSWRDRVMDTLGKAQLMRYLCDPSVVTSDKSTAEGVFYALRIALSDGPACNLSAPMIKDSNYNPITLWNSVIERFESKASKAGFLLNEIRTLIDLRLDASTTASHFVASFEACLLRLVSFNAKIAEDEATIRALLLRAIQDDDYKSTQDYITANPECDPTSIYEHLQNRETAMMAISDSPPGILVDGLPSSASSRRTQKSVRFNTPSGNRFPPWNIPPIPSSWSDALGKRIYEVICEWRNAANKTTTSPSRLASDWEMQTTKYTVGQGRNRNKRNRNDDRRSRRTPADPARTTTGSAPEESANDQGTTMNSPPAAKRYRITLRKKPGEVIGDRSTG